MITAQLLPTLSAINVDIGQYFISLMNQQITLFILPVHCINARWYDAGYLGSHQQIPTSTTIISPVSTDLIHFLVNLIQPRLLPPTPRPGQPPIPQRQTHRMGQLPRSTPAVPQRNRPPTDRHPGQYQIGPGIGKSRGYQQKVIGKETEVGEGIGDSLNHQVDSLCHNTPSP